MKNDKRALLSAKLHDIHKVKLVSFTQDYIKALSRADFEQANRKFFEFFDPKNKVYYKKLFLEELFDQAQLVEKKLYSVAVQDNQIPVLNYSVALLEAVQLMFVNYLNFARATLKQEGLSIDPNPYLASHFKQHWLEVNGRVIFNAKILLQAIHRTAHNDPTGRAKLACIEHINDYTKAIIERLSYHKSDDKLLEDLKWGLAQQAEWRYAQGGSEALDAFCIDGLNSCDHIYTTSKHTKHSEVLQIKGFYVGLYNNRAALCALFENKKTEVKSNELIPGAANDSNTEEAKSVRWADLKADLVAKNMEGYNRNQLSDYFQSLQVEITTINLNEKAAYPEEPQRVIASLEQCIDKCLDLMSLAEVLNDKIHLRFIEANHIEMKNGLEHLTQVEAAKALSDANFQDFIAASKQFGPRNSNKQSMMSRYDSLKERTGTSNRTHEANETDELLALTETPAPKASSRALQFYELAFQAFQYKDWPSVSSNLKSAYVRSEEEGNCKLKAIVAIELAEIEQKAAFHCLKVQDYAQAIVYYRSSIDYCEAALEIKSLLEKVHIDALKLQLPYLQHQITHTEKFLANFLEEHQAYKQKAQENGTWFKNNASTGISVYSLTAAACRQHDIVPNLNALSARAVELEARLTGVELTRLKL